MEGAMEQTPSRKSGTLYLVATPIGNLEDLTRRAERVLREADLIVAEDTRRTRNLLMHLGLDRPVERYDEHTERGKADRLVGALSEGRSVALVSDAGVPVVSDPGSHLVAKALAAGITVCPIPGASAVLSALAASGFSGDEFRFAGYPPRRRSARIEFYAAIARSPVTTVVFEAPHRVRESLADALEALGADREMVVARELTKQFEEILRCSVERALEHFTTTDPLGEFTLVFGPAAEQAAESAPQDWAEEVARLLAETDLPTKQAAEILAAASGMGRREAYAELLRRRGDSAG
jgi:16S rRNA (cytidine1402-2'-O)-methyltransferase